jgi:hypothetical protein
LIVWGAKDQLIPVEHAHAAHEAMLGSQLEIFADAGHFPHLDAPARFVSLLVDFMRSSEPARIDAQHFARLAQRLSRRPAETTAQAEALTPS